MAGTPFPRPSSRRRQRSVRVGVAVALLAAATVLVLVALSAATVPLLSVASVVALSSGWAAARIIYTELRQTWHTHARQRAQEAQAVRDLFVERAEEHASFARAMSERLSHRERDVRELEATLRLSERRATDAEDRVRRESRRTAEAQERVAQLELALGVPSAAHDALREDDSRQAQVDLDTVVDLLAWEDRGSSQSGRERQRA